MGQNTKLLDLPSDILLQIFGECGVLDILNLSSTCKQSQQIADEHQVWSRQARRLQIPVPPEATPSKAELKDWVISRTRVDVCWIKRRPGDLALHLFEKNTDFVDAHFIPGGEYIVLLYWTGVIGLNKIEKSVATGELHLREIKRYENVDDYPYSWSRLLTETSYGCPVLVWVGDLSWEYPSVFLIDPVSQVIENKQRIHCGFNDAGVISIMKILAMGDRIFFVCETEENVWVVFVAELSPNSVTRFFRLESHLGFDRSKGRFFAVSENGLIVTDPRGICLYHIPELRVVGDNSRLDPVWTWRGDASEFRGSLYKTASPCSALWLQGMQATHALEFDVDESGCFPVVVNHHITEGQPAYYVKDRLKLQGRKGMSIDVERHGEIVFNTGELGKPDLTRQLRAPVPGLNDGPSHKQYDVKYADLDEATGRIMIVASSSPGRRQGSVPYARRLYIADLPV